MHIYATMQMHCIAMARASARQSHSCVVSNLYSALREGLCSQEM